MGRRRHTYGRRKKIKLRPIIFLVLLIAVIVLVIMKLSSSNEYTAKINDVFSSEIMKTTGNINKTTSIDIHVYSNDGIKYTNKHADIIKVKSFDSSVEADKSNIESVRKIFSKISNLEGLGVVNELPQKDTGYYWFDVNVVAADKLLMFSNEEKYDLDLYYDIADQKIFIKNKYHDEFSKKNNKAKLKAYKADDECKKLIEELTK